MAHAAKLNELVGGLVRSANGASRDDASLHRLRDQAVKGLRSASHARTNQFDVKEKLDGLVEKFVVLNRDDLSEALQRRLNELPTGSKWMPEILSLLLQLSDRPVEKTRLEDVEALGKKAEDVQLPLTWEDIVADDQPNETGIWDDVERGYHSSGNEPTIDDAIDSDETDSTQATSVNAEDIDALARLHIIHPDNGALDGVSSHYNELQNDKKATSVSELTLIRETLLMLHGLPTSLYHLDESTGWVSYRQHFWLETVTQAAVRDMIKRLANIGSSLNTLRQWFRSEQRMSYLQSCQSSVQQLVNNFGSELAAIEQRYLSPPAVLVVSVMEVKREVENRVRPLLELSLVVESTQRQDRQPPSVLLDALYTKACKCELSGNLDSSAALVKVLLAGLRAYLKPLSRWAQTGSINQDDSTFLIYEANSECDLSRLWSERFAMRTLLDGKPSMPIFMHRFASRIFAMGKSHAFLQALDDNAETDAAGEAWTSAQSRFFDGPPSGNSILPFSQLLDESLKLWLTETSNDCTPLLQSKLLREHGALAIITELSQLFCSGNGVLFQMFADTLFWRMDRDKENWRNSFLLSELAQSALGSKSPSSAHSLTVRFEDESDADLSGSSIRQLDSLNLNTIFPWPVQNITRCRSPALYSKAFKLLLQIYRAKQLVRKQQFDLRSLYSHTPHPLGETAHALRIRQQFATHVDLLSAHVTSAAQTISSSLCKDIQAADGIDGMADVWASYEKRLETSLLLAPNMKPMREAITGHLELCESLTIAWRRLFGNERCSTIEMGEEHHEDTEHRVSGNAPVGNTVKGLQSELDKSLSFIVAGLRGIGRAGGNTALETLADRLEWNVP
ncbi:hypothetical protein LTR37_008129 [Vermiconidia calcicola]|uniref:Uncharacterized protein n=1 Tax=Vermiconidia calcicola TaxID=1690605 RepID=A0ACC3NBY6_9PEZI|nr:hypothetical protein LTR37_008129 [Vermiconidia calcicola]